MNNWTREETIVAFNVYCKIPFKSSRSTHPLIVEYANLLGRSASALNMKVGNFGRLDPDLRKTGVTGLAHGAKVEEDVWREFYGDPDALAYESEKIVARLVGRDVEQIMGMEGERMPVGGERMALVRRRVNQSFFRQAVMSAYNFRCCISGIEVPELVEACHIVGWADAAVSRTNPKNGLCLNAFFHKAYDNFLLGITPDLKVVLTEELVGNATETSFRDYLRGLEGRSVILPDRFFPQRELLEVHHDMFLRRHRGTA